MKKEEVIIYVAKAVLKSQKLEPKKDYAVVFEKGKISFVSYYGKCLHERSSRAHKPSIKPSGRYFTPHNPKCIFLMHVYFSRIDLSVKTAIYFHLEKMYEKQF